MSDERDKLKPFNSVIQACPRCGKVDVYKDDGHDCDACLRHVESEDCMW